jgi:protein-L-isoaspartate(D-aspartate) O-methyltransferase
VEMGAHGYGPHASQIAETIVDQVRVWDRDYRDGPSPAFSSGPGTGQHVSGRP